MRLAPVLLVGLAVCAALLTSRGGGPPAPSLAAAQVADADPLHVLGDSNCDERVDAVDALQVLRSTAGLEPVAGCIGLGNVNCDSATNAVDALGILRFTATLHPIASGGCPAVGSASMRLLTLDKFGDGTVFALLGGIACSDECTVVAVAAPDGAEVNLEAEPQPGSHFDHWSGCDPEANESCSVTLDRDRTVLSTFALDEVVVPPTTKALDDATMSLLLRVEGDTYYFDVSAAAVVALQAGDVIVSGTGGGLLRKVLSVTADGREIAVVTGIASIEDAIEKGTVLIHQELTPASVDQPSSALIQSAAIADEINVAFDGGVGLSGSYSFHPYLDVAINFDGFDFSCLCYPLREARAVLYMDQTAELSLFAEGGVSVSGERTIWKQPLAPITVPVGPVVLVFVPELAVNAGVSVTASAGFETGVSLSTDLSAGVEYIRGSGWHGIGDLSRDTSFREPDLSSSVEAKGYLAPEFSLKLYGVVGPYVGVEGFGRIEADPAVDPWWTVSAGVAASAGFAVDVPVFGKIAEFHTVVLDAEWVLARAQERACPPIGDDAFCATVYEIDAFARSKDVASLVERTDFPPHSCGSLADFLEPDNMPLSCDGAPSSQTVNCVFFGLAGATANSYCLTPDKYGGLLEGAFFGDGYSPGDDYYVLGVSRLEGGNRVELTNRRSPPCVGGIRIYLAIDWESGRRIVSGWLLRSGCMEDFIPPPEYPWPPA